MTRYAVHHTRRVQLVTYVDAPTQEAAEQKVADAVLSSLSSREVVGDVLMSIDGSEVAS